MPRTATNKETGERLVEIDGRWLPVEQTATGPGGQRAYKVSGRWVTPEAETTRAEAALIAPEIGSLTEEILGEGALGVDYKSGIRAPRLRFELSRASTDEEKEAVLDKWVGSGNYGKDALGGYYVKPDGLKSLGIESQKPVAISPLVRPPGDIVMDLSGSAAPILGAVAFGAAAPAGPLALPAIGMAALGGAAGRAFNEIGKADEGVQRVSGPSEVATRIAESGVEAGVGEGLGRGLMLAGRTALAPFASRVEPERKAMVEGLMGRGYTPSLQQALGQAGPLVQRQQGVSFQLFNNPANPQNIRRATEEMRDFMARAGSESAEADVRAILAGETKPIERLGDEVKSGIEGAYASFRERAALIYSRVDEMAAGQRIVPSAPIKAVAAQIEARAGAASGVMPAETRQFLKTLNDLPDQLTTSEAQFLRSQFRESADSRNLLKGVEEHFAGKFKKSVDLAFDEAAKTAGVSSEVVSALRRADGFYREGIRKFDAPLIDRIVRDARFTGSVESESVMEMIWRPKRAGALKRVMNVLPNETRQKLRTAAMEDLLSPMRGDAPDGVDLVLSGAPFRARLDQMGRDMLETMFGRSMTDDLYKFADRMVFLTAKQSKAGSVAAPTQGMHWIRYFFPLTFRYMGGHVMAHPGFVRWMALGVGEGPKARVAREIAAQVSRTLLISTTSSPGPAGQGELPALEDMPDTGAPGSALQELQAELGVQ